MTNYKFNGNCKVKITPKADYSFSQANSIQIANDLNFLICQVRSDQVDSSTQKLYSRVAIVFLAFYFESLANSLFDMERKKEQWGKELIKYDNRRNIPKPIRKFCAQYKKEFKKELPLDINGLKDLFLIRNQVFAHPQERTTTKASDISKITKIQYSKFTDFPNFYPDFGKEHFEKLLAEVKEFLKMYSALMRDKIPKWLFRVFQRNVSG